MKYKVLVLDIDGTLLNSQKEITPRTLTALKKIQQMGIRIILASGRPDFGIAPIAEQIELHHYGGYIISYNGAQITDAQSGDIVLKKTIDPELFIFLDKEAKKNGFDLFTYHEHAIVTDTPENEYIQKEAALNKMDLVKVTNLPESIDFSPCKCMFVGEYEKLITVEYELKRKLNGVADILPSEPYFLEIVPQYTDKANTLSILLAKLGVKEEEVMAIGDGVRDVNMIQLAGLGIAMGNAQVSVTSCADRITSSNDEDGVAVAIEQYLISPIKNAGIPLDQLNEKAKLALMGNLGIKYTYASEERIEATMPVDQRTRQPFGILHGGATLALAETVAGLGSMFLCAPDEFVVGMQVSGNHMSSAHEGDTVRAVGTIIHKGRSSHVWNVDVFTSTDKLVSSIRVVNSVLKKR